MLAELVTKPNAAWYILGFVVFGILCCLGRLWYIWWTTATCSGCGKTYNDCDCSFLESQ